MTRKKKCIILSIIVAILIAAVVIVLLCFVKKPAVPAPEATDPTIFTDPTVAPTEENTMPPAESTDPPADPTDPTETAEPSAPTITEPTADPTQAATQQPTTQSTQAVTQKPTQSTTQKPTQVTTQQPTVPSTKPTVQPAQPTQAATQSTTAPTSASVKAPRPTIQAPVTKDLYLWLGDSATQLNYDYSGKASDLTWYSNDPTIATVNQNGMVTPISEGRTTIAVYAGKEDDGRIGRIHIVVGLPENKTTAFDYYATHPFYDGIEKIVGNELEIDHRMYCRKADGTINNITDVDRLAGFHSYPTKPTATYPNRNVAITSSNPAVISVVNEYKNGVYKDFLRYNSVGTAIITFTSWDGYSESFTVRVKEDYDCAPGKSKLTPSEYAYYASLVCLEESGQPAYQLSAYLYQYLSEDEITWERAKSTAHFTAGREYTLGQNLAPMVIYAGWDKDAGKHLFYIGGGSAGSGYEKYDPPAGSNTGPIRFPGTELKMLEHSGLLLEVLGDTRNGYVTYTSSDPSVVIASGGFLIAQKEGSAVITATYKGQETRISVTVERDPNIQRIHLEKDTLSLSCKGTNIFGVLLRCTYFYWGELTWHSSNPSIATAEQNDMGNFLIFPHNPGECVITITDGVNKATCTVIVTE